MGATTRTQDLWLLRARQRAGLLTATALVVALTSAASVLLLVLGPTTAQARSSAITDPATARAAVTVAAAVVRLAVAVLVVLASVTLSVLASRVVALRADEDTLLLARGATPGQLIRRAALEGALVGVLGTVSGCAGATAALLLLAGDTTPDVLVLVPAAAVTAVSAVLLGAGVAAAAARSGPRTSTGLVGQAVVSVVLLAAAAFTTWRSSVSGVPIRSTGTTVSVDLAATAAPVSWVLAGATLVVLGGGLLAGATARAAIRWRGLLPAYVARRTARSWAAAAPVVLVVGVVAATGVFVAGFAATTAVVDRQTARAVVGPDVRLRIDGDPFVAGGTPTVGAPRGLTGVLGSSPVLTGTAGVGAVDVALVAVPGPRASSVVAGPAGDAVRRLPAVRATGIAVDRGSRVDVDVRTGVATLDGVPRPDATGSVGFDAWVVDRDGVPALVPLTSADGSTVAVGDTATVTGAVPTTGSGWRLLAVEPTLSFSARPDDADALTAESRLSVRIHVAVRAAASSTSSDARTGSGGATAVDLAPPARIVLGRAPASRPLPVVLTSTLADRLRLRVGSTLDVTPTATGTAVRSTVTAIVPDVPGTGSTSAVVTDLRALTTALVEGTATDGTSDVARVDEQWLTSSDPAATVRSLRGDLPPRTTVTTTAAVRSGPVVAVAVAALAVVAGLGVLFGALVLVVVAAGTDRSRRVLRASGVPARTSARARAAELALPPLLGVLGGTASGVLAVAVTVVPFAIAAVPAARGLVVASPVAWSGPAWVAPTLLLLVVVGVGTSVLLRGRRTEVDG